MSKRAPGTLPILKDAQARASAPDRHVWLAASAGTGKTQVLAARVYRLLLRGVDPSAILCLTFTKAGAAEMAGRINGRLAAWVRMPVAELRKDLLALGEEHDPVLLGRARRSFAKVLDAPGGGLRIQTIHGFCQSLLASFPLEAGLVPGFRPLEAREEALLARETLAALLVEAERDDRPEPVATLGALSIRLGEGGAEDFLRACAGAGEALDALPVLIGPWLRERLGLPPGAIEDHIRSQCGDDVFDREALQTIAGLNRQWGTKSGVGRAEAIGAWLAGAAEKRSAGLEELHQVWAKADGDPRSFAKGQAPTDPAYADLASRLHGHCAALLSLRVRADYADLLAAALTVGRDYADAYARAKRRIGKVDFDDLIAATVRLLGEPGMGDWVRYKLDLATEHILIDEAQDTNLRQWQIVGALAGEFFAGAGARGGLTRTLFTVGDYKQAIFGFQGTDPTFFAAAEQHFQQLAAIEPDYAVDRPEWTRLSLTQSFRSTRAVLEFVDAAVAQMPAPGMGAAAPAERHASEVPGPGAIELWPPVSVDGSDEGEENWVDDAVRALAIRIARQVRDWLAPQADGGLMLGSKGRPLRPEDVMILVKRRGELASLLVARLHAEGVPVAGVDRLRLNGPLAVQDLLAAIRFALQPEDDLSLACLLVSPLMGWSQDDLMAAAPRERGSLWRHLLRTQSPDRLAPLAAMLARVDLMTPYQFLEELLSGPLDGRRSLLRRLGREARDPIDELLAAALEFETTTAPSLQRFLDWFDRGDVDVVRDAAAALDAVRVMTAHGAKGLQAPLVILADACVDPTLSPRSTLRWSPAEGALPIPMIRPRAAERGGPLDAAVAQADGKELEEHWRLFYVAATRAEERLVIAGSLGVRAKGAPPALSWYTAAARAMDALGVAGAAGGRVFVGSDPQPVVKAKARDAVERAPFAPLPAWAREQAPVEARPPRPLAPSALGADEVADPPPGPALRAAAERGRLVHGLFERLPDMPADQRAGATSRWLAGQGVAEQERDSITASVLAIVDHPRFAALFGPGSLGEAPIAAVVADGVVVSGTVDRLLVTDAGIRLVDFKTARRAPAGLNEVPTYHLRQLAAYAAALGVIFPGRRIEAALLYTAGPVLIELPPDVLAAHKPGLARTEQSLAGGG